jgi:DNA-directed RNA polymerase subunit M/transcription elongation factor TFIIS
MEEKIELLFCGFLTVLFFLLLMLYFYFRKKKKCPRCGSFFLKRTGYSLRCQTCGFVCQRYCPNDNFPLVLEKEKEKEKWICPRCGYKRELGKETRKIFSK